MPGRSPPYGIKIGPEDILPQDVARANKQMGFYEPHVPRDLVRIIRLTLLSVRPLPWQTLWRDPEYLGDLRLVPNQPTFSSLSLAHSFSLLASLRITASSWATSRLVTIPASPAPITTI